MKKYDIEPLANAHCETGENPYYDPRRHQVFWTDIPQGRLFCYDLESDEWEQFYDDELVGGFTIQEDGNLLIFRDHNFAILNDDGEIKILKDDIDITTGRFNDVFADPEGRVFAGTGGLDGKPGSGGLFRVDHDGTVSKCWNDTDCSNGMGFTPDLKGMYWTDSTDRIVYLADYDRASGELSNRRIWKRFSDADGIPDGMTVDAEGCIWQAFWDGFAVRRYTSAGELMEEIKMPVGKVSSVTFGGKECNELFITTAGGHDGSDTADGTLYRVRVEVKGRPEYSSRIGL